MNQIFYDAVGNNPIIAAVKNMKDIEVSCTIEEIQVIFILFGDVCSIDRIVKGVKDAGRKQKNLGCIRSSDIFCWIPWHLRISDSNSI